MGITAYSDLSLCPIYLVGVYVINSTVSSGLCGHNQLQDGAVTNFYYDRYKHTVHSSL